MCRVRAYWNLWFFLHRLGVWDLRLDYEGLSHSTHVGLLLKLNSLCRAAEEESTLPRRTVCCAKSKRPEPFSSGSRVQLHKLAVKLVCFC